MVQCFHELTKENRGDLGACATPWWQCLHDLNPTEEMKSSLKLQYDCMSNQHFTSKSVIISFMCPYSSLITRI